ncbi:MAG: phosphatase PAP2 family protein [Myxococcota bacterium]|nr:phosphatase PAP2 family protein [Myxococcota bacterium]
MFPRLLAVAALIAAAHLLDAPALSTRTDGLSSSDGHRALRVAGFLPVWMAIGTALALHTRRRAIGVGLTLSAGLAGLLAEIGKLLIRRGRPGEVAGYTFHRLPDDLSTAGLGMPSSHAAVAFGGAFLLARLYPRVAPVVVLWAVGCGLTRVLDGAHFLSDVVAAAGLAWLVSRAVAARLMVSK